MQDKYLTGIDIGSTTVKLVICNPEGDAVFSRYRRHHSMTRETLRTMLEEALSALGDVNVKAAFTGSAGMGLAETYGFPFIQEVVASSQLIRRRWPEVKTFIEIGGEDSKVVFFEDKAPPDIRMNGSCAGGTGAFIDQMAVLLDVSIEDFDLLAQRSAAVHPIASRCGVFAKTDVQSLLSNHVPKEDIVASVFHAVALQTAATLFRGRQVEKKVLLAGGPLGFFRGLRRAFMDVLGLDEETDIIRATHPELIAALGASLHSSDSAPATRITVFLKKLENLRKVQGKTETLPPLFATEGEFLSWQERHEQHVVEKADLRELNGKDCFLGIDSGSTTTKIILMDSQNRIAFSHYSANNGDPVKAVQSGLLSFGTNLMKAGIEIGIARSAVTGYGEDLIRAAFGIDDGIVETMAHYRAARTFSPQVSFILDIGGQDMKAIFIKNDAVSDIQVNEACSSGCGSFLETFARSLNCDVAQFAHLACQSDAPFDLGTRCTVFMNSKVKQAQREGASISDISAGLAYAVVKNSLYKVLKLTDVRLLGKHIVTQGGAFRNPAILRAFEILTGKEVIRPDITELMGAYGAAITARNNYLSERTKPSSFVGFQPAMECGANNREILNCKGCENKCRIVRVRFSNGRSYFTGNRCENSFSNHARTDRKGLNLAAAKEKLLFDRPLEPEGKPILSFGIPRALNMYENFPFWSAYLTACGFRVVLSSPSTTELFEQGVQSVMSDNICFPGKLAHGHIMDLINRKVDRIFYPNVVYEQKEHSSSCNSFNCPVVTGYPDVIRSASDPEGRYGIPLDSPAVSFKDAALLEKQLFHFVRQFGVKRLSSSLAVRQALKVQDDFKKRVLDMGGDLIAAAERDARRIIVLSGRPYHIDPLINHGIPELLAGYGVDVVTEDALPLNAGASLRQNGILTQWAYANRVIAAAEYVGTRKNMSMVQLASFGCGLDALSSDEARRILEKKNHSYTLIKIDEMANLGAVKIRLRSLLETDRGGRDYVAPLSAYPLRRKGEREKIIVPWISPMYSPLVAPAFAACGLSADVLAPPDRRSVELGLQYVNNDLCYPAAIIIGDIIKAFRSGRYDPERTAIVFPQTFGQCRASSYLPLMERALQRAGYEKARVLSMSIANGDLQIDLPIDKKAFLKKLALQLIFADALARLYYATAPREIVKGEAGAIHRKFLERIAAEPADFDSLLILLKRAVAEFNSLEMANAAIPVVGVLGEIYVKYNAFANNRIVEWLLEQGLEVRVPPLLSFFMQCFTNESFNQKVFLKRSLKDRIACTLADHYACHLLQRVETVMESFRYYQESAGLRELAEETSRTVSLVNQAGEGWLLTAEMIAMLQCGVNHIVCVQPFGCLANHITGKGVSRRLQQRYPRANLLFLDMDAGHSEVNLLNRLHLLVAAAKENAGEMSDLRSQAHG
ncbi:MAG TPA: acyl-CoA dehydratase activase [Smithellaceae bacterium]|nr:acyl-CoA dehydratase activase [Smithellaceae bacterium]